MDRRTIARELAMQALCQLDVQAGSALGVIERFFTENSNDELVLSLAMDWTKGAWRNLSRCDELVSRAAVRWELSRLSMVDKSILRLSAYQLVFCADIPPKVVINEAIEMAKKFSGASSAGFVNGVLDAINKKLDREENTKTDDGSRNA